MKVYKYFNSLYKTDIEMGHFLINTFYKIRDADNSGAIYDPTEGRVKNLSGDLIIEDSSSPKGQKIIQALNNLGAFGFIGPNCSMSNCVIHDSSFETSVQDAYMFCVTRERHDHYWAKLPESQGGPYDSCLEIENFIEFSRRLHTAFYAQQIDYQTHISDCFHENNQGIIAEGSAKLPSYFRKPVHEDFRQQYESRVVLIPLKQDLLAPRTVFLKVSDIARIIL